MSLQRSAINEVINWVPKKSRDLKKCGSEHYIRDLMNLIKESITPGRKMFQELNQFGCSVPNCKNIIWMEAKTEGFQTTTNSAMGLILNHEDDQSKKKWGFYKKKAYYSISP